MTFGSIMRTITGALAVGGAAVLHAAEPPAPATQPVVKGIADFESGTFDGWTVEGPGFGAAPFKASTQERDMKRAFTGWEGDYMLGTLNAKGEHGSRHQGIKPTVARSPQFTIEQPWIVFQFGAELNPGVRVTLSVDGQEVRNLHGNNIYDLVERGWDVTDLKGKQAQLVVHAAAEHAVLVRFDHAVQRDYPPKDFARQQFRPRWETNVCRPEEYKLALGLGKQSAYSHSITRGHDGRWHLFATVADYHARYDAKKRLSLVHASSDSLNSTGWTNHGIVFTADSQHGETLLSDTNVVFADGKYHLFYVGSGTTWGGWRESGGTSNQGPYHLHLATSTDGQAWQRHAANPILTDNPFLASPYITRVNGKWTMYYGGTVSGKIDGDHCVVARTSDDLVKWSDRQVVLRMLMREGFPEHPYLAGQVVVNRGPYWYMLGGNIGNENQSRFHYRKLFVSANPFEWFHDFQESAGLFIDGNGKIVRDTDGRWFITTAGAYAGGVWIAPLRWYDGQDNEPSTTHPASTPVAAK